MKLGLSGNLTRAFIGSPLTPLMLLAAVLMGVVALLSLPREEEPQISVPLVDIMVRANGLKAGDAVELVTKPLEDIVKGIPGVEHVYSQTEDDQVIVTARFFVGTDEDTAVLRIYDHVRANYNRIPIGIPEPLIVGRGIDDVAILVLTLTPKESVAPRWDDNGLYKVASELQHELIQVENVGLTYIVGGRPDQIRVEPDPERLSLYGVTLNQLVEKVRNANRSFEAGAVRERNRSIPVVAGQTLQGVADIGNLLLSAYDGRPVYVKDVATVVVGAAPAEHQAWHVTKAADGSAQMRPAVSLAFAKRKGTNAVVVADQLLSRLALVEGRLVPNDVQVTVTRNYGQTAQDKANELLFHLLLATITIVGLVSAFIGWREGVVVLVVVPATILLTFFASWLLGYTINRVSLFALIFSIGILVDDAIVVVENIVRHWRLEPAADRREVAIRAVAEVGNPTIIATLTIIAALLPMMFVSGLMGPYMSPIPANASAAMLFSFFVAVIIAPWLLIRLARRAGISSEHHEGEAETGLAGVLVRFYRRIAPPILKTRRRAGLFLLGVGVATVAVCGLFYTETVTAKLLPFDNKPEVQVVANLPHGTSLEETDRVLSEAARRLIALPEVTSIQAYAGTSAPFTFNGLVRHYYLRDRAEQGDLQVNLLPKGDRDRASHTIAIDIRNRLQGIDAPAGTSIQTVEVPPGPPVLATLLAEIYGPDGEVRRETARRVRKIFEGVPYIVDTDDSFGVPSPRLRIAIDQDSLEFYGVEQQAVYDTIQALLGGTSVGYSHRGEGIYPIEIAIRLPKSDLRLGERLLSTPVPAKNGTVELGDLVKLTREDSSYPIFRRDGHFAEMVMADLAGEYEAPIYGMLAVERAIAKADWGKLGAPAVSLHGQPTDDSKTTLLWDGEWEITYVTFRDMGIAFGVAILAIYLLIVGEFRSFRLPLVIMTPIPLTLIGIVIGHWLFGAPFTATSMIGFISLAGIIVRNSILLVDFIRHEQAKGLPLRACLLNAGAIRFRPILLTALAAMVGAAFILLDPIFQGLAISLLFGLASSTALTLLVIPAIYVLLRDDGRPAEA
ncbi:MAG: efflux RND transporter permease subunit [Candidatus Eiseniibacteriota bacterium]